ncbi:MAG: hypothetical protein ONB11_12055 [candidate division KSB1 bacterium]|nr:hypothetical protein [candidate division KSB1 bacterium]
MKFSVSQYRGRHLDKTLRRLFPTSAINYWDENFAPRFGSMICGLVSDDEVSDHDAKFTFLGLETAYPVVYAVYKDNNGKIVTFCEEELINVFNGIVPYEIYFKAGMDAEFEV